MSRKVDLFEDLAAEVESWVSATTKSLMGSDEDLIWVQNQRAFKDIKAALVLHKVSEETVRSVLNESFQGLAHSFLCILDGTTALAERGRIYVVDENGDKLGEGLHEEFLDYLPDVDMQ